MKLLEIMSGPIFVFHGTTQEKWNSLQNQKGPTSLYLASERSIAISYAKDSPKGSTPIIVKFQLDQLMEKLKELQQDKEIEIINWNEALASHGVFSVFGMIDEIKPLGKIILV